MDLERLTKLIEVTKERDNGGNLEYLNKSEEELDRAEVVEPKDSPIGCHHDVAAGADGRLYKLVRYPTAGYWVAYSRTTGDAPVVSVTMKKMLVAAPR